VTAREWLPIESVPRKGEVLLCWIFADGIPPHIRIGEYFHESSECFWFKLSMDMGDFGATAFTKADYQPTHWMPLPEPPK
jgi:hypothetical protein